MSEKMHGNPTIKCSVDTCAHHSAGDNLCTLSEIRVGCTCADATRCESTECASFKLGPAHGSCHCP